MNAELQSITFRAATGQAGGAHEVQLSCVTVSLQKGAEASLLFYAGAVELLLQNSTHSTATVHSALSFLTAGFAPTARVSLEPNSEQVARDIQVLKLCSRAIPPAALFFAPLLSQKEEMTCSGLFFGNWQQSVRWQK